MQELHNISEEHRLPHMLSHVIVIQCIFIIFSSLESQLHLIDGRILVGSRHHGLHVLVELSSRRVLPLQVDAEQRVLEALDTIAWTYLQLVDEQPVCQHEAVELHALDHDVVPDAQAVADGLLSVHAASWVRAAAAAAAAAASTSGLIELSSP